MPFTMFFLRLIGLSLIALFVGAMLGLPVLSSLAALAMVWLALLTVPLFIAEALGFLHRAARFFFGAAE
jgi:hypothetical protein